jgi:hypothetical protein
VDALARSVRDHLLNFAGSKLDSCWFRNGMTSRATFPTGHIAGITPQQSCSPSLFCVRAALF